MYVQYFKVHIFIAGMTHVRLMVGAVLGRLGVIFEVLGGP